MSVLYVHKPQRRSLHDGDPKWHPISVFLWDCAQSAEDMSSRGLWAQRNLLSAPTWPLTHPVSQAATPHPGSPPRWTGGGHSGVFAISPQFCWAAGSASRGRVPENNHSSCLAHSRPSGHICQMTRQIKLGGSSEACGARGQVGLGAAPAGQWGECPRKAPPLRPSGTPPCGLLCPPLSPCSCPGSSPPVPTAFLVPSQNLR